MGVTLRRRFGFQQGRLTAYEDEHLAAGEAEEHSAILETEIERPRVGPMRDIVATIQPEQDVIVRSELSETICVQGAPGTGKTAVGLHRAAYLLYAYRERLGRRGVLVVGPNASFLRFIRDVLPALGEIDAKQTTIVELVADTLARLQPRNGIRGEDSAAVATLKGDARMAAVLERALWSHLATPTEGLVVPRGARRWRVARTRSRRSSRPSGIEASATAPRGRCCPSPLRTGPAQDGARRRCPGRPGPGRRGPQQAGQGLRQRDLASGRPTPLLWRLLSEPAFLAEAADGIIDPAEQGALLWPRPPRSAGAARWSPADAVLLDEAADLVQRTPSLAPSWRTRPRTSHR